MSDLTPEAVKALRRIFSSQIGDDVQSVYDHEALFKEACALATAYLELAEEAAGYLAVVAMHHATLNGRAPNVFHAAHYDRLKELGARMDGFVRATEDGA